MRSNISLYIGSLRAELDDDSLVLLNYAFEDLANPTTILNSYSRTVTLRGTPENNRIFGEAFRLDRHVTGGGGSTGTDFNAGKKTPFTLQNAAGEILMTGYVKLNRINRTGQDVTLTFFIKMRESVFMVFLVEQMTRRYLFSHSL